MQKAVFAIIPVARGFVGAVTSTREKISGGRPVLGLPGGKVDPGETDMQALLRECGEEGWGGRLEFDEVPVHTEIVREHDCRWYIALPTSKPVLLIDYPEYSNRIYPVVARVESVIGYGNDAAFEAVRKQLTSRSLKALSLGYGL